MHWYHLLLRFGEDAFLLAHGDGAEWAEIFAASEERATALHAEVTANLRAARPAGPPFFYMLRHDGDEFVTERVEQVPDDPGEEFLQLKLCRAGHRAAGSSEFEGALPRSRPGGLTILEGPAGTGKTSLLSVMMRRLEKTHVFYVLQAAQDHTLSAPEFVPFWQSAKTSAATLTA